MDEDQLNIPIIVFIQIMVTVSEKNTCFEETEASHFAKLGVMCLTIENVLGYAFGQVIKRGLVARLVWVGGGGGGVGGRDVGVGGEGRLVVGDKGDGVGVHLRGCGGRRGGVDGGQWPEGVGREGLEREREQ